MIYANEKGKEKNINNTFNDLNSNYNGEKNILLIGSNGIIGEEKSRTTSVPYGIWNLGNNLREKTNYNINILDPNLKYSYDSIKKYIRSKVFDTIGFSLIPANLENDLKMLNLVKEIYPNTKIVVGGIESKLFIDYFKQVKNYVDYLIIGDGIIPLIEVISSGKKLEEIRVYNNNNNNNNNNFIPNDLIPFDFKDSIHDFGYKKSKNFCLTVTNECSLDCFWCVSPKNGPFMRDIDEIINTLEDNLSKEEYENLIFYDNDIAYNYEFKLELFKEMILKGIFIPKNAKACISTMTEEMLDLMSDINFKKIAYGVESFDTKVSLLLGKNNNSDKLNRILNKTLEVGIVPEINLILFSPFETLDTLKTTILKIGEYVEKGAIPFVVTNLYSVLSTKNKGESRGLSVNYKNIEISSLEKNKQYIKIPTYYKNNNINSFIIDFEKKYLDYINKRSTMSQLDKSLVKLIIISEMLGMLKEKEIFEKQLNLIESKEYINI